MVHRYQPYFYDTNGALCQAKEVSCLITVKMNCSQMFLDMVSSYFYKKTVFVFLKIRRHLFQIVLPSTEFMHTSAEAVRVLHLGHTRHGGGHSGGGEPHRAFLVRLQRVFRCSVVLIIVLLHAAAEHSLEPPPEVLAEDAVEDRVGGRVNVRQRHDKDHKRPVLFKGSL